MAVLQTNYVNPGSIPAAITQTQATPAEMGGLQAQAQEQNVQKVGGAFDNMLHGLNYMYSEDEKANLRDQWRQMKAAEKAAGQQQSEIDAQNKLYVAQTSINAQFDANNVMQQARQQAQPNGNLSGDVLSKYKDIITQYTQNAPNSDAARDTLLKLGQQVPKLQEWGFKQQASIDSHNASNVVNQLAQKNSVLAYNDPGTVNVLHQQVDTLTQAFKDAGVYDPHLDTTADAAKLAISKNSFFSIADNDPLQAKDMIQQGAYPDILAKDPQFTKQLHERMANANNKDLKGALDGLKLIPDSITGNMQPPTNAADLIASAQGIAAKYKDINPQAAQQLTDHAQIAANLMKVQQSLTGATPDQVKQIQLQLYSTEKNLPGDAVTLGTAKLTKELLKQREELFKNSPMDVEAADGTIKAPSVPVSTNLNNDPKALQQFTQERMATQDVLSAKGYRDKHGNLNSTPFQQSEIQDFANSVKDLDPVAKLNAMQFTNKLPSALANPLLKAVAGKTDPENAMGAAIKLNAYDPEIAKNIAMGQAMITGNEKLAAKVGGAKLTTAVNAEYQGLFQNDPQIMKQNIGAAEALVAHEAVTKGTTPDEALLQDKLKQVSGIDKIKLNDNSFFGSSYNTVMPYIPVTTARKPGDPTDQAQYRRMTSDEFSTTIKSINDADTLQRYGNGLPVDGVSGKTIDMSRSKMDMFKWTPSSDGKYMLQLNSPSGNRPLVNDHNGKPFEFDMKQYLEDQTGRSHG